VVAVSDKNDVQAFKVTVSGEPLFTTIKNEKRARIQETAITADAVLPGGPYDLWRDDETTRRVKDLVGAFARFPHLPKMLNPKAIFDTLVDGCRNGLFVLRLLRPDRSVRTWWREAPDDTALKDPGLEVVLPEAAALTDLAPASLVPQALPGLWEQPEITFADLCAYFSGGRVMKIPREGYDEPVTIPKVERVTLEAAVQASVRDGTLWLTSGPASIFAEEIPAGLLTDDAKLQAPPPPVSALEISPDNLPEAWSDDITTALAIAVALSKKTGKTLPWVAVQKAIDGACRARLLERTPDSGTWPCDFASAAAIKLRVPQEEQVPRVLEKAELPRKPGVLVAAADLQVSQIQDLAEHVAELAKLAVGFDLTFHLRVEFSGTSRPSEEIIAKMNKLLSEVSEVLKLQ
jgi:hypothetical protein